MTQITDLYAAISVRRQELEQEIETAQAARVAINNEIAAYRAELALLPRAPRSKKGIRPDIEALSEALSDDFPEPPAPPDDVV